MKIKCLLNWIVIFILVCSGPALAETYELTIIHTNDLHSHFLGHSPNKDYSPLTTGGDKTIGGWARIATVIKQVKESRRNPVVVVDSGDFLVGTLFHMVSREEALELGLMSEMGFDAVAIGNHEFDLKPSGLAKILTSANQNGKMPAVVVSNLLFDDADKRDDTLKEIFEQGIVKPYIILTRGELKIGIFGILGVDAAEKAPFKKPVTIDDPIETSRRMVNFLRNEEKVDVVICLSHSGIYGGKSRSEIGRAACRERV